MEKGIKQIAVILGAINLDNQKKLLEGMGLAAKEIGCNLFTFTNYVGTRETEESIMASSQILGLPDFKDFDGVILAANTIHNPIALNKVVADVNMLGKPAVSIDRKIEGFSCIGIDSYEAQYEMVEHFLYHGYTNIAYVTGPIIASSEARTRLRAFQDAMLNNGMPFREENIYEGAFTLESGITAAKKMLEDKAVPEAIVCGNDDMAHGVIQVFKKAGYKIPEDIKVAGFDNGEMSRINRPTLTTVDKNQTQVGYKAIYELMELLTGKDIEDYQLPCKLLYRESCGCTGKGMDNIDIRDMAEELKQKYVKQQYDTIFMTDVIRGMSADFAKARTPEEIYDTFKEYVSQIGIQTFYLCTCEKDKVFVLPERNVGKNIDVMQVNGDYTEFIDVAVGYEKGQFVKYDKFKKGLVLPEDCRNKSGGNVYAVNQIFYQKHCYGYAVCEQVDSVVASGLYYSMLMEIATGLENVRQRMLLKDAVDRLNGMWCYDNLTMLFNRSGFIYEAKNIMDNLKADDKNVFIIFMDADGLKTVNDGMGHEFGDMLIRELGAIVHRNVSNEMLGMRYGGDEFVLFGGYADGEEYVLERTLNSIEEDFKDVNASGRYPFNVSASIGTSVLKAREVDSLDVLIEQADKLMYEEKRRRKQERR